MKVYYTLNAANNIENINSSNSFYCVLLVLKNMSIYNGRKIILF